MPSISVRPLNVAPTSAADAAIRSSRSSSFHRKSTEVQSTMPKATKVTSAAGTCTYMIFCRCPIIWSGGDVTIA